MGHMIERMRYRDSELSSEEEALYSDAIDSDIEAELYSSIHHDSSMAQSSDSPMQTSSMGNSVKETTAFNKEVFSNGNVEKTHISVRVLESTKKSAKRKSNLIQIDWKNTQFTDKSVEYFSVREGSARKKQKVNDYVNQNSCAREKEILSSDSNEDDSSELVDSAQYIKVCDKNDTESSKLDSVRLKISEPVDSARKKQNVNGYVNQNSNAREKETLSSDRSGDDSSKLIDFARKKQNVNGYVNKNSKASEKTILLSDCSDDDSSDSDLIDSARKKPNVNGYVNQNSSAKEKESLSSDSSEDEISDLVDSARKKPNVNGYVNRHSKAREKVIRSLVDSARKKQNVNVKQYSKISEKNDTESSEESSKSDSVRVKEVYSILKQHSKVSGNKSDSDSSDDDSIDKTGDSDSRDDDNIEKTGDSDSSDDDSIEKTGESDSSDDDSIEKTGDSDSRDDDNVEKTDVSVRVLESAKKSAKRKLNSSNLENNLPLQHNHTITPDPILRLGKKRKRGSKVCDDDSIVPNKPGPSLEEKTKKESEISDDDSSDTASVVSTEPDVIPVPDLILLTSSSDEESDSKDSQENSLSTPQSTAVGNSSKDLWYVNNEDLYRSRKSSGRYHERASLNCLNCNSKDHLVKNCPNPKVVKCFICGENHHAFECHRKLCNRCHEFGHETKGCHEPVLECLICRMSGHTDKMCPDLWRRYMYTTQGNEIVQKGAVKKDTPLYCFNCGKRGHYGSVCTQFRVGWPTWTNVISYEKPITRKRQLYDSKGNCNKTEILPSPKLKRNRKTKKKVPNNKKERFSIKFKKASLTKG